MTWIVVSHHQSRICTRKQTKTTTPEVVAVLSMSTLSYREKKKKMAELCVYGFVRIYCSNQNIPTELKQLCLLMYFVIIDTWNIVKSHNQLRFDCENNICNFDNQSYWRHAMGSIIIKKGDMNTWKINITKESNLLIGITNIQTFQDKPFYVAESDSFGIHSRGGEKWAISQDLHGENYAVTLHKNDIITMTLDIGQDKQYGKLSYKINDKDYGVAFDKIAKDGNYCLIISGFETGQITLLQ